jgi:hypothetical protein
MRRVQCDQRPKPNRALPAAGMAGSEDTSVSVMVALKRGDGGVERAPHGGDCYRPHWWCQSARSMFVVADRTDGPLSRVRAAFDWRTASH